MIETMVSVENLTKTFRDEAGAFNVINEASFFINKGEMISLVGVSGAGQNHASANTWGARQGHFRHYLHRGFHD